MLFRSSEEKTDEAEKETKSDEKAETGAATASDAGAANAATASDAADNADNNAAGSDGVMQWTKGYEDLVIRLAHPVSAISVNGTDLDAKYYSLSEDGKTVSVSAGVLNGWGNGTFKFTFSFSDGTEPQVVTVRISGEKPADTISVMVKSEEQEVYSLWRADGREPDAVKQALASEILKKNGYTPEKIAYFDVSATIGGAAATNAQIAALGGVEITLPYPAGTNAQDYDFAIGHLKSDGTVEVFEGAAVLETNEGVKIKVTSLSPFAVAWKSVAAAAAAVATPVITAPAAKYTPATGDTSPLGLYAIIFGVMLAALIVVIMLVIRKNKRNK